MVVQESIATWVRDKEDQATLAVREAQEGLMRVEAKSATTVAYACEEVELLCLEDCPSRG
jgi:hypothetical protein